VFFSYLHSGYEHAKVLSTLFRRRGMTTVAGGRHAAQFPDDCARHFDAVVTGDPETNVPRLVRDLEGGRLQPRYDTCGTALEVRPWRWDLIDYRQNPYRFPTLEASRGCPFSCSFCVLTGRERYRFRPVKDVVEDITTRLRWNRSFLGAFDDCFGFLDASALEIRTIRAPVSNGARRYIAGLDELERWDCDKMRELGLEPQRLG
jgi:radical SAM superfamily enzyme YgiQ (UPF0313 family)